MSEPVSQQDDSVASSTLNHADVDAGASSAVRPGRHRVVSESTLQSQGDLTSALTTSNSHDSSTSDLPPKRRRLLNSVSSRPVTRHMSSPVRRSVSMAADSIRGSRLPRRLQPSRQRDLPPAIERRRLVHDTFFAGEGDLHSRGDPLGNPYINGLAGTLPMTDCDQDHSFFAYQTHHPAPSYSSGLGSDSHHGAVQRCQNTEAHQLSPHLPSAVCVACRSASHTHIRNTDGHLLKLTLYPLCGPCGHLALLNRQRIHGCNCGSGWLCHHCRYDDLSTSKAKSHGEFVVRTQMSTVGFTCHCGKDLTTAEAKAEVEVLQCAGCSGLYSAGWDDRREASLIVQMKREMSSIFT